MGLIVQKRDGEFVVSFPYSDLARLLREDVRRFLESSPKLEAGLIATGKKFIQKLLEQDQTFHSYANQFISALQFFYEKVLHLTLPEFPRPKKGAKIATCAQPTRGGKICELFVK